MARMTHRDRELIEQDKDKTLDEGKHTLVSEETDFCLECWQLFFVEDLYMGLCDDCYEAKIGKKRKPKFDDER